MHAFLPYSRLHKWLSEMRSTGRREDFSGWHAWFLARWLGLLSGCSVLLENLELRGFIFRARILFPQAFSALSSSLLLENRKFGIHICMLFSFRLLQWWSKVPEDWGFLCLFLFQSVWHVFTLASWSSCFVGVDKFRLRHVIWHLWKKSVDSQSRGNRV